MMKELDIIYKIFEYPEVKEIVLITYGINFIPNDHEDLEFCLFLRNLHQANTYIYNKDSLIGLSQITRQYIANSKTKFIDYPEAIKLYDAQKENLHKQMLSELDKYSKNLTSYYNKQERIKNNPDSLATAISKELFVTGKTQDEIKNEFVLDLQGDRIVHLLPINNDLSVKCLMLFNTPHTEELAISMYELGRQSIVDDMKKLGLKELIITKLNSKYKPTINAPRLEIGKEIYGYEQDALNRGVKPPTAITIAIDKYNEHNGNDHSNRRLRDCLTLYKAQL